MNLCRIVYCFESSVLVVYSGGVRTFWVHTITPGQSITFPRNQNWEFLLPDRTGVKSGHFKTKHFIFHKTPESSQESQRRGKANEPWTGQQLGKYFENLVGNNLSSWVCHFMQEQSWLIPIIDISSQVLKDWWFQWWRIKRGDALQW